MPIHLNNMYKKRKSKINNAKHYISDKLNKSIVLILIVILCISILIFKPNARDNEVSVISNTRSSEATQRQSSLNVSTKKNAQDMIVTPRTGDRAADSNSLIARKKIKEEEPEIPTNPQLATSPRVGDRMPLEVVSSNTGTLFDCKDGVCVENVNEMSPEAVADLRRRTESIQGFRANTITSSITSQSSISVHSATRNKKVDCKITCTTNGSPVCSGSYVMTGYGFADGKRYSGNEESGDRECTKCGETGSLDGSSQSCKSLISSDSPVVLGWDVNPSSLGLNSTASTKSCFEKIDGKWIQVAYGQKNSDGTESCTSSGAWVEKKEIKQSEVVDSTVTNNAIGRCVPGKNYFNEVEYWLTCKGDEIISMETCREGSFDTSGDCIHTVSTPQPSMLLESEVPWYQFTQVEDSPNNIKEGIGSIGGATAGLISSTLPCVAVIIAYIPCRIASAALGAYLGNKAVDYSFPNSTILDSNIENPSTANPSTQSNATPSIEGLNTLPITNATSPRLTVAQRSNVSTQRGRAPAISSELNNDFVYYNQRDPSWAAAGGICNYDSNGNTINNGAYNSFASIGCGITVTAMLITNYTTDELNPQQTKEKYFKYPGYNCGSYYSDHELILESVYNFQINDVSKQAGPDPLHYLVENATMENPIVLGFHYDEVPSGHYVLVVGNDGSGNPLVMDPYSGASVSLNEDTYPGLNMDNADVFNVIPPKQD